jgi:hypothetical protein
MHKTHDHAVFNFLRTKPFSPNYPYIIYASYYFLFIKKKKLNLVNAFLKHLCVKIVVHVLVKNLETKGFMRNLETGIKCL